MNAADFSEQMSGRLIKTTEGHLSFVPHPLPPNLVYTPRLVNALVAAQDRIARLEQAAQKLASPHLISGISEACLAKEAQASALIEGTQATLSDVLFPEASNAQPISSQTREVKNHLIALRYGLSQRGLPLSKRLLRVLHEILLRHVRGDAPTPREFRRTQVHIGQPGSPIEEAYYVPPPPLEMMQALNDLEKYLHENSELHILVRAALVHYQFEAIHPFNDGNGRIGRLLIMLMLCMQGGLDQPLVYMSAYFMRKREEYYRRLLEVSTHGRWEEWLLFFLTGVMQQAEEALRRCEKLIQLHTDYVELISSFRSAGAPLKIIDELFQLPYIAVNDAERKLGLNIATARRHIDNLVNLGILREVTGQRRNRIFVAQQLLDAIDQEI